MQKVIVAKESECRMFPNLTLAFPGEPGKHSRRQYVRKKEKTARESLKKHGIDYEVSLRVPLGSVLTSVETGFPGSRVQHLEQVYLDDQVIPMHLGAKTNWENPESVAHEYEGQELLANDPIMGKHVSHPKLSNRRKGLNMNKWEPGKNLKIAAREEKTLYEHDAVYDTFVNVVNTYNSWFYVQPKQEGSKIQKTLQREQWQETMGNIQFLSQILSIANGLQENAFWDNSILVDGIPIPPLKDIVACGNKYFTSYPDFVVIGHGDPHGGNIIMTESTDNNFKLIDFGNVGFTDVEEELAKLFKQQTTSNMLSCGVDTCQQTDQGINLQTHATFPDVINRMQEYANTQLAEFAKSMQYPELIDKYYFALSMSYLREIVNNIMHRFPNVRDMDKALATSTWALEQMANAIAKCKATISAFYSQK